MVMPPRYRESWQCDSDSHGEHCSRAWWNLVWMWWARGGSSCFLNNFFGSSSLHLNFEILLPLLLLHPWTDDLFFLFKAHVATSLYQEVLLFLLCLVFALSHVLILPLLLCF